MQKQFFSCIQIAFPFMYSLKIFFRSLIYFTKITFLFCFHYNLSLVHKFSQFHADRNFLLLFHLHRQFINKNIFCLFLFSENNNVFFVPLKFLFLFSFIFREKSIFYFWSSPFLFINSIDIYCMYNRNK